MSKATIVCKTTAKATMKKLGIERDMVSILFHDYLALCDPPPADEPKRSLKTHEGGDSHKPRPFISIPTCSIRALQNQANGDTSVVMTVWETELSLVFSTANQAALWHNELSYRVAVIDRTFGSFASAKPCPEGTLELYHCGQEYFSAVADAIEAATTCVMITGWWFSPQIYLKRDTFPLQQKYRLDNLLQAKAQLGVKVYIIVFKENELAINLGSRLAKAYMESLDRNISMMVHGPPNWAKVWYSHHQKTVIIDQEVAFLGGIDLCFGRYDSVDHPLSDLTPPYTFVGADYYNQFQITVSAAAMQKPFVDIMDKEKPMRETMPREPWNDVHARVVGGAARDVAMNFIQRWAAHNLAAGLPFEPFMTIAPIPIPVPPIRHEPTNPMPSTSEIEDEANIVRYGDQIRLWAWSPACVRGVAGGYVGLDKKHKLCGLGPGSADRFSPSSFRVISTEETECNKAGCTAFTDHPEILVCPKHADCCHAQSCSNERRVDSDYCEDHHFSAAVRTLAPPVCYGDKVVLLTEKQTVWNNDVRTTWFRGYIKLDKRGVEGEMYVTFLHNPNLPLKASKPINYFDSGVSIKVVSSHCPTLDLDNVITLYPKRKTQGFLGCLGGSPLTFTLHHAGPSEAEQRELDALNTRIQQLLIKKHLLKEAVPKYEAGPARDNIVRSLEEAEASLADCIEERRHPKWRFSSMSEVPLGRGSIGDRRDSQDSSFRDGSRSGSRRPSMSQEPQSRQEATPQEPRRELRTQETRPLQEPQTRQQIQPDSLTQEALLKPMGRVTVPQPTERPSTVTLPPSNRDSQAVDPNSLEVDNSPPSPTGASLTTAFRRSTGTLPEPPSRDPPFQSEDIGDEPSSSSLSDASSPTSDSGEGYLSLTISHPPNTSTTTASSSSTTSSSEDSEISPTSASYSSAASSPHSPHSLTTSLSAPSLLREEPDADNKEKLGHEHKQHHLRHHLSAPTSGKVRVHLPQSPSSRASNSSTSNEPPIIRTCQVLRSLTNTWSGGTFRECSILTGYLHAIAQAKRFIYIEQQFFVSSLDDPNHPVRNLVAKALFDRISQAILDHELFSVVIVLPISPEGAVTDRSVRLVMHYQRCSIDRGKFSLMKQLEARFKDVQMSHYLNFYALRTHDPTVVDNKGRPRTMQIYVHSKLLIADDRVMILGSANINDRSLSGNRDSEICIRVEEPLGCGLNSIQRFRRKLWANYLAVEDIDFPEGSVQSDLARVASDPNNEAGSRHGASPRSATKDEHFTPHEPLAPRPPTGALGPDGTDHSSDFGRTERLLANLQRAEAKVSQKFHKIEYKVAESLHKAEAMFEKALRKPPVPPQDVLNLEDAASLEVQAMWRTRAQTNTAAYQSCYPNLPHSSIKSHAQLNALNSQAGNPAVLEVVKGFVVHYPRLFLEEETMMPDFLDKENLVPADCFT